MDENDLARIARELDIAIPDGYCELMRSRADELSRVAWFQDEFSSLYLDAGKIIEENLGQREKNSGTAYAFPRWWKKFFLIGTNGGGDYYCLRLSNKPGVWMIGSDCGDEPTLIAETLPEYVNERIAEYEAEQRRQAEAARRRLPYQEEIAAHRQAIARNGGPEDGAKWMDCSAGYPMFRMLDRLEHRVSPRKLRLYGIACCRRIPSLEQDEDCAAAIGVAERMTAGTAADDEIAAMRTRMRERLEHVEGQCNVMDPEEYGVVRWRTKAVLNLFQDDNDYLTDAPIFPNDPELKEVYNAASYALYGCPYGSDVELDLLREVLGNPFVPLEFAPRWRSEEVVRLARKIYDSEDFDQLEALSGALAAAGCDDPRILSHCRRKVGHVRGCWVLDLILESEPDRSQETFSWDFECTHPHVAAAALKQRLQSFGTAAGENSRSDDKAVPALADWLQENGDPGWAEYLRVRCALDGKPPGEDYADLVERLFECGAAMRANVVRFEGFYFSGYRFAQEAWWSNETDDMRRGLPSLVQAVQPGRDPGPAKQLAQRIGALVENTPVRGVDFEWHYADQMEEILDSPGGRQLRILAFANRHSPEETGAAVGALAGSFVAPAVEHLRIQGGITSDGDARALASAPFANLRRLDLPYGEISCSPSAVDALLASDWFQQLRLFSGGFGEGCGEVAVQHLARMPHLHSLALNRPSKHLLLALKRADAFAALRRLAILGADLTGECCEAFCALNAPRLIELWLGRSEAKASDVCSIIGSPLFERLLAVTFAGPRLTEASLNLLAESPCAADLRILRMYCGDGDLVGSFKSLGSTALTQPGAFPALTTLTLEHPYAKKAKRDTAQLLSNLATPNLRQLTLKDCDFDDDCAAALARRPVFANLTRLHLEQEDDAGSLLSPKAAKAMLRSANLQNLVELELHNLAIGKALDVLADETILPKLAGGAIWGGDAPTKTEMRLKTVRPNLHIGS
jgi:uncharacterized protein (TIGR02996 family)